MKAYHIDRFGSVGGIVRRSSEDPRPGPKEVLTRVRASSLNYRDLMARAVSWRGVFSMHTWIAVKPSGAPRYARYEVLGFGVAKGSVW